MPHMSRIDITDTIAGKKAIENAASVIAVQLKEN